MNKLRLLASSSLMVLTLVFGTSLAYGQITPSADAYINSAAPAMNYGANVLLNVNGATQSAYIQFNLASIPSTYTSADITQATLKLYVNTVATAGSFNVDYVNGTWAENTISHNLAPALGTTIAASVPITTADKNQFILIDVTAAVQAWLSGTTNDGVALVANGTFNATFDSKENAATSHAPELDLVYAGTLSGVTTASGSGLTGGGTSGTLNLGLLTTCTSGQVLQWSGTAWACATPKGTGTVTKVASGAGLTGGPITGSGTLSIATGGVTNAMLADSYAQLGATNTFTGNETVNGTITANSPGSSIVGNTSSSTASGVVGNGAVNGVTGTASSVDGYAVVGLQGGASVTTSAPAGVYGASVAAPGSGVWGNNANYFGVYGTGLFGVTGETQSANGYGLWGLADSQTGSAVGVYGSTQASAGYGVEGTSPWAGVWGTGGSYGVYGKSSDGIGVFGATTDGGAILGQAAGFSNTGISVSVSSGVQGDTGGTSGEGLNYVGVLATADSNVALQAENKDSTGDFPTMIVVNNTASANTHFPVFQTSSPNTYSNTRHCTIDTSANLTCTGVVSGVVGRADGKQTAIYAMQSAENWLEDAGSGQLSGGSVRIEIDSAFAQTVNAGVEYHVFLTPNGDSKGLYVSQKTATSFEVHEQGGGTSSIAFDYRIMAKRKGYENVRLEDVTERFKQRAAPVEKTRRPLPSTATGPAARPPAPQVRPLAAPRLTEPMTVPPRTAPLPHPAAQVGKAEVNHK